MLDSQTPVKKHQMSSHTFEKNVHLYLLLLVKSNDISALMAFRGMGAP